MQEELKASLGKITIEWNKAEELIKLAERVRAEVVMASVNELRYAGRRMVDAWRVAEQLEAKPELKPEFEGYVQDALFRCHCACHDAIDATVLFVQMAMDEYEKEFGLAALMRHFPEVADLRASLAEADELIVSSRKDRGKRASEYDKLAVEHLPTIAQIYKKIKSNRAGLVALVADTVANDNKQKGRYVGGIMWGGIIAAIAAVLGGAVTVATSDRGVAMTGTVISKLNPGEPASPAPTTPAPSAPIAGLPK